MVPMAGIGPATSPLPRECSTTEPHGLFTILPLFIIKALAINMAIASNGAGDEARTHDIQFGKLKLYQLSYTRLSFNFIAY